MLTYVAVISLFSILYAYFGYALILYALDRSNAYNPNYNEKKIPKTISIIIACRNEESSIKEKLQNTLSLQFNLHTVEEELIKPDSKVEVIIADDASDDDTYKISSEYFNKGVKFVSLGARGGKEKSQKNAVNNAKNEIILFTDSKVLLSESSINSTLKYFSDDDVGAISSIDKVIDKEGKSGENAYVKYEMKIREMESNLSTLIGLSGSCFAVRKEIARTISENIPSDFFLLLSTVKHGLRGRHAPDVIAYYKAVNEVEREFERKVRTVLRGMRALFSNSEFLNPKEYGFFSFQLISHKLYRWLVPFFFILLFFSSFLLSYIFIWKMVFLCQIVLLLLSALGYYKPELRKKLYCKLPLFLLISNAAILIAWVKLFRGEEISLWNPSKKG
jgi:cellulose synthase/poly-beta-1,6-N-acetylglucosamine synthase-like glycosyltransferase